MCIPFRPLSSVAVPKGVLGYNGILDGVYELLSEQNPFILAPGALVRKYRRDDGIHVWIKEEWNRDPRLRGVVYHTMFGRYVDSIRPLR